MKNLFVTFTAMVVIFAANAQAPQAFNYQAAVYNASGNPIANQMVSLRISILNLSATGPVLYSESFSTVTDNAGMFTINIGTGTVLSGSFTAINWARDTKWQKSEIDTTGGSTYVLMGTSQYLSVPYALYANQSNSASIQFPDGLDNISAVAIQANTTYTVPASKNLYISFTSGGLYLVNGDTIFFNSIVSGFTRSQIGVSENSTVQSFSYINGFLADKKVTWINHDFMVTPSYMVPANKQLIVKFISRSANGDYGIDGTSIGNALLSDYLFLDENQVLTFTPTGGGATFEVMAGYLKDK